MTPKVLPEALIEELLAAAEKATPGPWQIGRLGDKKMSHVVDFGPPPKSPYMILLEGTPAKPQMGGFTGFSPSGVAHADDGSSEANAAFIALANPQTISALIAEVKAARATEPVAWIEKTALAEFAKYPHSLVATVYRHQLDDCWVPLYAAPPAILPSTIGGSVGVREEMVERLAAHLCDEYDVDFYPVPGAAWPEDENDDGKRDGGYIAIQPKHVQARAREIARRILSVASPSIGGSVGVSGVEAAADREWDKLCEKDDRSSPVEYPDMALITRDELRDAIAAALPTKDPDNANS